MGTIFTSASGEGSQIYGAECGPQGASVVSAKKAFLFSDFGRVGVYAKADSRENQVLAAGTPNENNVAGLVCMADDVELACSSTCHDDRCPEPDAQPGQGAASNPWGEVIARTFRQKG